MPLDFIEPTFGDVEYISQEDAETRFHHLYELDRELYLRETTTLTSDETFEYQKALTVPDNNGGEVIKVRQPFLVVKRNGQEYLINGNGRFSTMKYIRQSKEISFLPIPYQVTENITDTAILRLQIDLNDTTRKNSAVEKLRQVHKFLTKAVDEGMKLATARKRVCEYFNVSQQTVSDAKKLFEKPLPDSLTNLLESGVATTDGAIKVLQCAERLNLPIDTIPPLVVSHSKKSKVTKSSVNSWRDAYLAAEENANKKEVVLEKVVEEGKPVSDINPAFANAPMKVKEFEPEPEPAPAPVKETKSEIPSLVPLSDIDGMFENTNHNHTGVILRIAAQYLGKIDPSENIHADAVSLLRKILKESELTNDELGVIIESLK